MQIWSEIGFGVGQNREPVAADDRAQALDALRFEGLPVVHKIDGIGLRRRVAFGGPQHVH